MQREQILKVCHFELSTILYKILPEYLVSLLPFWAFDNPSKMHSSVYTVANTIIDWLNIERVEPCKYDIVLIFVGS